MRWNVWVDVIGDRDRLLQLSQYMFEQVDPHPLTEPSSATIMKGSAGFTPTTSSDSPLAWEAHRTSMRHAASIHFIAYLDIPAA